MGVRGLWELLAPVGRRVSVETLAGKKLAIDASIWMIQFMKAMRDERGEMVRNAHLLGFFRRICKLLYLRVKPIFIFDGGTPALKRRTVIARRRQRENAQAKIRKTAEKLLLNHLKAMKLKEIAEDIKDQRQKHNSAAKGKKVLPDETKVSKNYSEKYDAISGSCNQEKLDEMLAASIAAEEDESLTYSKMMSAGAGLCEEDGDEDEDEDMMLPDMHGEVDPAVLAALVPSLQHKLIQKQEVDSNGKKTRSDEINILGIQSELGGAVVRNQVKLDEMLAASIMAKEDGDVSNKASTSAAAISFEDGDADDESGDEEMILPTMHGKVDPAVLAALPPSMQLDLLVQIRERLMAENRQKYQKVKKDPGKFSELQIEAYLKTVAFRREIDQVQKAAAGRGVGGIQTSRIASESNRKFIFSSSFTGDKQVLAAGRAEKCGDKQQETLAHSSSSTNTVSSANKSNKIGSTPDDSRSVLDENIETYQDERGRIRVSRVRAMGIHMTRDLQRNLDLMKEIELERTSAQNISNSQSVLSGGNHDVPENFTGTSEAVGTSQDSGIGSVKVNERNEECMLETNGCIEISFEDNGDNKFVDGEDDLFACLVTGSNTAISSCDNTSSKKLLSISDSDCEWEEGAIEERGPGSLGNVGLKMELPAFDNISDDAEVEWEEMVCEDSKVIPPCPTDSVKLNSKGCVEEDADLEEAIRRSLEDIEDQRSDYTCQDEKQKVSLEKVHKANCFLVEENKINRLLLPVENAAQPIGSNDEIMNAIEKVDAEQVAISNNCFCPKKPFKPSVESNSDDWTLVPVPTQCERECGSPEEQICFDREGENLFKKETNYADFGPSGTEEFKVVEDHNLDASKDNGGISTFNTAGATGNPLSFSDDDITDAVLVDKKNSPKAGPSSCSVEVDNPTISLLDSVTKELRSNIYDHQNLVTKENHEIFLEEGEKILENSTVKVNENVQVHFTEANLEEEIKTLEEECIYLGNEHKRLERNAESVSSEMFTECQELLQMFGLPYIIAPMEAEAQCAFMEEANIVDGVVTDDSDAFLFGARSVYKNIFDDRKYVETYFMKDIENELGLTREKLIRMALLLGSDYTEGVSGIGIVNAIEVVNAFPEEDGLKNFRDWVESPDPTILGKSNAQTGSSAGKKSSKVGDGDISRYNVEEASRSHGNSPHDQKQQQSSTHIQETMQIFMDKHRKISKNWHIPLSFPSEAVISAYSCPQVDKSTESFTWGKPDHFVLRKLCWEKFGWVSQKADEILLPVLKEYSKHETQLRLEAFYTFNERFAKVRSKRIKKAVKGIIGNRSSEMADDDNQKVSRSRKKKRSKPIEPGDDETEMLSEQQIRGTVIGNQRSNRKKATSKHSQNRLTPGEEDLSEPSSFPEGGESTNRSSRVNGRGGGRRVKGRVVGRGKEKGSPSFQTSETSSSDTGNNDDDAMKFSDRSGRQEVRRSTRLRKPVDYISNDVEIDDVGSVYQSDKNCFPDMAEEKYVFLSSGMNEGAASGVIEEKQQCADTFSLGEGSSRNYLETGGGFCLDEGESDQLHDNRQDDCPEAKLSDDYRKMGPGLSVGVDGIATNEDESPAPATATISTSASLSRYSVVGASDGHALEQGADQVDTIISNDNQNASDGTGKRSVGTLSVMPNLRRKRRRN